jgi:hypothetical protein
MLVLQLVKRGYDFKYVNSIASKIGDKKRDDLLPYKSKITVNTDRKNLFLFFKFNTNSSNMKNHFVLSFNNVKNKYDVLREKKLFFVNNIDVNIGSLLIHNFKFNSFIKYNFNKCNNPSCKICVFSNSFFCIKSKNFLLPFKANSNCDSKSFIYIIHCKRCNIFYIGESSRTVKLRIGEHIKGIVNFQKNLQNHLANLSNCSETAIHFNLRGHCLENDFEFNIFNCDLDDETRWSTETDLINIFLTRKIPILNIKQSSIYKIRSLTFHSIKN